MTIIYDGKNMAHLCAKLPGDEAAILSSDAFPLPGEAIYYMEKDQDPQRIRDLPLGWAIEMERYDESFSQEYPERIFTRNFERPILLGKIHLCGSFEAISSLCRYLARHTRIHFGLTTDAHRLEMLRKITKNKGDVYTHQPLHLVLGRGDVGERHLYLWDGSMEELYQLREAFEELPRYHYLVQRGLLGKSFHEQNLLHGRFLGRISKRGSRREWTKILHMISTD